MTTQATLKWAFDTLLELGTNPLSADMRRLAVLVDAYQDVPSGNIQLSAMVAPGGVHKVTDQHGREVDGVKSVATFVDNGVPVFQVIL